MTSSEAYSLAKSLDGNKRKVTEVIDDLGVTQNVVKGNLVGELCSALSLAIDNRIIQLRNINSNIATSVNMINRYADKLKQEEIERARREKERKEREARARREKEKAQKSSIGLDMQTNKY